MRTMTLRLFSFCAALPLALGLSACGDDSPMLTDTGTRDTGTVDGGRDTSPPRDTGTDGCRAGMMCTPTEECQEGRVMCDPERCEASGPAGADTECTIGTCDGLGTCVRTEDAMWTASDEAMADAFGGAVAIDGDYAVIGVGSATGGVYADAAYVFERDSGGNWAEQAILDTGDVTGGQFGVAVDIDADRIVVGCPGANHSGQMRAGRAYVFTRGSGGDWTQTERLEASDPALGQRFGTAVAIDGDRIAVGGAANDSMFGGAGKIYVFEAGGGTWSETANLSGAGDDDELGASVDIEGDVVVAGAPGIDAQRGSIYVFTRDGGGTWSEAEVLQAAEGAMGDELGAEVLLRGSTLVASAPRADEMSNSDAGAVYVFTEQGDGSYDQTGRLVASDGATEDHFGAIALDGDTLLVGAPSYDRVTRRDMGIVYVFARSGDTFTEQEQIYRETPELNDRFGAAVAISGTTALVGAPSVDIMTNEDSGAVFFYSPLPAP
jgi:hypothetical protein